MNGRHNWKKDYPSSEDITEEKLDENHSLKKMFRLVGENKQVIDFGCATGYFSQMLTEKGCRVTGVEINPDAAKVAEQYCEQVIVADLDLVSIIDILPNQTFDVAVFGDVLEHLKNPWQVLNETQKILKANGYVVASIPNIGHGAIRLALLQGEFEYTELGILDSTHLRFFTRKTVQQLFERSGYFIDYIDYTKEPVFSESPLLPNFDRNSFENEILQRIEKDEQATTVQFIIKAFPLSVEGNSAVYIEKYSQLVEQLASSHSQLQQTQAELAHSHSQLQQTQAEFASSQSQLQQTQPELEQLKATITAMQTSKFWKLRTQWLNLKKLIELVK